jgi:hypothetical protein
LLIERDRADTILAFDHFFWNHVPRGGTARRMPLDLRVAPAESVR